MRTTLKSWLGTRGGGQVADTRGASPSRALPGCTFLALAVLTFVTSVSPGQTARWTQQQITGPSARTGTAMAFDAARGQTVLFGGSGGGGTLSDTWVKTGTAWSQKQVSGPAARAGHAMAYDAARGVVVMFGGEVFPGWGFGGHWEWDGATWTERQTDGPQLDGAAMVYDSARQVVVLFGGRRVGLGGAVDGTWEWNGSVWTQRQIPGPWARSTHAMAYDSARGVTVLFGGFNGSWMSDTWEWDGATWTQRLVPGPQPRGGHGMAYDAARGVTVLFGGFYSAGNFCQAFSDTWEWDGTAWTPLAGAGPSSRQSVAMAYDSAHATTVLFGGGGCLGPQYGETWRLVRTCNAPGISLQPNPLQSVCPTGTVTLGVVATGSTPLSYQWRHGAPPVAIAGANGATYAAPAIDGAVYDCVVSNACGTAISDPAMVVVCYADLDDGTGTGTCDGGVDINDLLFFLAAYEAGNSAADLDDGSGTGTPDGAVTIDDLLFFLAHYEAGC